MAIRLWVYGSLAAAAMVWALLAGGAAAVPATFAIGLLLWSALEYLMHRFAFHGFAPHWQHHAEPKDPQYTLAALPLSLSISAVIGAGLWFASRSATFTGPVLAGMWIGYLAYEEVHLRIHSSAPGGKLLRTLRRYHYRHHFADDTVCYGVTSPLWDLVFRTR